MAHSLLLDDLELIGGPVYRLAREYDFGTGEPTTYEITSRYLDGSLVRGVRTSNRQVKLTVNVFGTEQDVRAAVGRLAQAVNQQSFTLTWTPSGELPMVLDCFRGTLTPVWDILAIEQGAQKVELSFAAAPFARNPTSQVIVGSSAQVQLDAFETDATGGVATSAIKFEGAASNRAVISSGFGGSPVYSLSRSFSAKNLSDQQVLQVRVLWTHGASDAQRLSTALELRSASGRSKFLPEESSALFQPGDGTWHAITYRLDGGVKAFGASLPVDLSAVTSYVLTGDLLSPGLFSTGRAQDLAVYHDSLQSLPAASTAISTARGAVYQFSGVQGTARAPMSVQVSRSGGMQSVLVHRPPSDGLGSPVLIPVDPNARGTNTYGLPAPAQFAGTYAVVLAVNSWGPGPNGAPGLHRVEVRFDQGVGAVEVAEGVIASRVFDPAEVSGRLLTLGYVTLPLVRAADDGSAVSYLVTVSNDSLDSFTDLMLVSTDGQTVIATPTGAFAFLFIDEPAPGTNLGPVLASPSTRPNAFSVLGQSQVSGGPMSLDPGSNRLLVLSPEGSPAVQVSYKPRWLTERTDQPAVAAVVKPLAAGTFGAGTFGSGTFGGA